MHGWRMWTAVDGLPPLFYCGKGRVRSPSAGDFRQEDLGSLADTIPIPRPHLRWGCWLLKDISTEMEDYYD